MKNNIIKIHPLTVKSLKNGHPWVTKDQFSEKFPEDKQFIKLYHPENQQYLGLFINDKKHPRVKARLWSTNGEQKNFSNELRKRLNNAFKKRETMSLDRDNYYLVFGEADFLPGLYIQKLSNHILLQYQAYFWENIETEVINLIKKLFPNHLIWTQLRIPGEEKKAPRPVNENQPLEFHIQEFDIKYKIKMNLNHDIGIYSDMSGIRQKLSPYLKDKKSALNLFCYTGAFSLFALKHGLKVTSVDLSKKYISWLEENLEINDLNHLNHLSLVKSCQKQIDTFLDNNTRFDLVICDPPTVSTDGKKRIKATDFYKDYIEKILKLVTKEGVAFVILNTHQISLNKFKNLVINNSKKKPQIIDQFSLCQDCSPLPSFTEGNYLKCLILKL